MSHVSTRRTTGVPSRGRIRAALSVLLLVACGGADKGVSATVPRPIHAAVSVGPSTTVGPAGSPGDSAAVAATGARALVPAGVATTTSIGVSESARAAFDGTPAPVGSTIGTEGSPPGSVPAMTKSVGTPVTRPVPTRIVSLSPTATETLFALGAAASIKGVDQASTYPPSAPRTTLNAQDPDVAAVLALSPDLVVTESPNAALTAALAEHGIQQLIGEPATSLQDSYDQIRMLGAATGHSSAGSEIVASMQARVAAIVAKAPARPLPLRYYHERDDRYTTVTSTSFLGQVYGLLHLQSIADGPGSTSAGYRQVSAAAVLDANPDLVFLADAKCCRQSIDTVRARPGWSALKALDGKGIVTLDDDLASRWGPRIVDLLQAVSNRLSTLSVN